MRSPGFARRGGGGADRGRGGCKSESMKRARGHYDECVMEGSGPLRAIV